MDNTNNSGTALFNEIKWLFAKLIGEDRSFIYLTMIYGLAVSILTLAVPISVQMLINSIAHTASTLAVATLAVVLLVLLLLSGIFVALQIFVMELFERRFYARITAEFTLRVIYADYHYFTRINRHELINRYFDIMHVQKIIPSAVMGMFAIVLQMVVGILVVSFYHPWLLLFNLSFVLLLWLIWRIWGYRAMASAIELSSAKYETARHLEDVARANDFFKSSYHSAHAIAQSDELTGNYIACRKKHFGNTFSQQIGLLLLYAVASAGLLGIGGILVVNNELSLGQLVAAELILSAVFVGIARLGYYLVQLYDLGAVLEEIWRIFKVPLEEVSGSRALPEKPASIHFRDAQFDANRKGPIHLEFVLEAQKKILAMAQSHNVQETILEALKRYRVPRGGTILFGDHDIRDYDPYHLRHAIMILDKPTIIECTIESYLRMGAPDATLTDMEKALEIVELQHTITNLDKGLQTKITPLGKPLTGSETLRLKLAGAILAKPHLLILNELFDTISYSRRQRIFERMCRDLPMTLLYFSNRKDLRCFDHYLFAGYEEQILLKDVETLREYEARK